MLNKFKKYHQENELFKSTDKILLTVSGGKDSIVMLHFFKACNLSFGVAHCNFQLRGEDAKRDQEFVKEFCNRNDISFYTIEFETQKYATKNGISIQMAARDLRYEWFEKIRLENNYQFIATAHHKNDVAETMLINLAKGTGLTGLHGISNKKGNIIRPLLCFTRNEIDDFVKENNIDYREDLSNANTKYTRNSIRHRVIPELEKINQNFIETANIEANQFSELEQILNQKIEEEKKKLFLPIENGFKIEIENLKKLTPLKTYLYYFLRDYSFNSADVEDIIKALDAHSGKAFYSSTHQIIKDRDFLLLSKIEENTSGSVEIKNIEELLFNYQIVEDIAELKIEKSNKSAYLDFDKIQFPLILRKWKEGDSFQPLGMKGNKKVSDFLIDNKVSIVDKNKVKILEQNGEIIWLVGHRINDRFKITNETQKVLILK